MARRLNMGTMSYNIFNCQMPMDNYAINMISNILSGHLDALNVKMLAGF